MTKAEINAHPTVAPLLAAWRAARAERDRVLLDGRFGDSTRREADQRVAHAERAYDTAVAALRGGGRDEDGKVVAK